MNLKRPVRTSILAKTAVFIALFSLVPLFVITLLFTLINREFFWVGTGTLFAFTVVVLGVAFGFAQHLTRPIRALMQGVQRISQGDFSTFVAVRTHDELQDLANAFNGMSEDLKRYREVRVDEVLAEKTKTEGIVFASEDGIILTDENGHVQLMNPKAKALLELEEDKEALTGRPIWSFVKQDRLAIAIRESVEGDSPKTKREVNLSAEGIRRYYLAVPATETPSPAAQHY